VNDFRLAIAATGIWLACLAGLRTGLGGCVGIGAAAGVVGACSLWSGRAGVPRVAAMFAIGVAAGSVCTGFAVQLRDAGPLHRLAVTNSAATLGAVVRDDPKRIAQSTPGGRPAYAVTVSTRYVDARGERTSTGGRVLVLSSDPSWAGLLPGQAVEIQGRLQRAIGGDLTSAVMSARGAPSVRGRPPWYQRLAGRMRTDLQLACGLVSQPQRGLLPGLVDGDVSRLDPVVEQDFRDTGMTHLVAVSGSNCAIVMGTVVMTLRRFRLDARLIAVLAAMALGAFVVFVRPSPSVIRAGVMGLVALLGIGVGRPGSAMPALAAATGGVLLADPSLAVSAGFSLSVLATFGIVVIAPRWRDALLRQRVPGGLAEAIAVPAAAQVMCAPVIAAISGGIGLAAVPANLLAVPAVAPATIVGVAAALLAPLAAVVASWVAWVASWPAWWLVEIAHVGAHVPDAVLGWPSGAVGGVSLAVVLAALLFAGRYRVVRQLATLCVAAVICAALPVRLLAPGWPPPGWLVVGCAVGQGDTVVLRTGAGTGVVIDAGPEPGPPDECLHRLGIRSIPLLVISHFHADHVDGIEGVLRGRTVGAIVHDEFADPEAGFRLVEAAARRHGVPFTTTFVGATYQVGDVWLEVIGPVRTFTATRSDPNNNSLVLRAIIRGVSVLLTGDAENTAQHALLGAGIALGADVLKVPHHGSSFSEPDFLDAVHPRVAIVEVGLGNDYGHPNAGVLRHLREHGARVLRTDLDGDVAVIVNGRTLAAATRGAEAAARSP
jgi:competence protein ComEC